MSTITRIKGEIENYSLPVITEEGLLPYWEGVFVNFLKEEGYTLSTAQRKAISTFLDKISKADLTNAVRYFWPFIGDSSNTDVARIPLIGTKKFNFNSSFSDFMYGSNDKIIGITSTPAVGTMTAMDFCDEHSFVVGVSFIKKDTSEIPSSSVLDRVISVGNPAAIQVRALQVSSTGIHNVALYSNIEGGGKDVFSTSLLPNNITDAGNAYMIMGYNDKSAEPHFCRAFNLEGEYVYASGSNNLLTYAPPASGELNYTLSAQSYTNINAVTGVVVFNRVLQKSELEAFIAAHKAFNVALGKEVG